MNDYRLYSFVNFYLSSIQQGVQTAHLVGEMAISYLSRSEPISASKVFYDWANIDKTIIILNGGANDDIEETYRLLANEAFQLGLPFELFNEDDRSLAGIMTCCGVILPNRIYNAITYNQAACSSLAFSVNYKPSEDYYYVNDDVIEHVYIKDSPEWKIINMLKSCGLAR